MRQLLFKQMTSIDKKRRAFSVQEINRHKGINSRVSRHYIYFVKKSEKTDEHVEAPTVNIIKKVNSKTKNQELLFKAKGSFYAMHNNQSFLVNFCRSLKIKLDNNPS